MKRIPLILVEWLDARTWLGWRTWDEALEGTVPVCESAGWLIQDTDIQVKLVGSRCDDQVGEVTALPTKMVRGIWRLEKSVRLR